MDTYRTSDYIIYTPQSYTSKLTFNSDKTALEKNQKAAGSGINMMYSHTTYHSFPL